MIFSSLFQSLRTELGAALHPAHYLAISPGLFELVVDQLRQDYEERSSNFEGITN